MFCSDTYKDFALKRTTKIQVIGNRRPIRAGTSPFLSQDSIYKREKANLIIGNSICEENKIEYFRLEYTETIENLHLFWFYEHYHL